MDLSFNPNGLDRSLQISPEGPDNNTFNCFSLHSNSVSKSPCQ